MEKSFEKRYTEEEAIERTSKMKEKIEKGEAGGYDEAEKLVETEQALSVEDIKKHAEDLKTKVESAKAQREKDVEQKLTDRETLIAEAKRNEELLTTAQETLEYFTSMQKLDELKDPADVKKLEEIKTLVASLEKQRLEIDKKVDVIENRPEVLGKLYDTAKQDDIERTVNKELEQAHEQLNPQIDQLAQSIKNLAERKNSLWRQKGKQEKDVSAAWNKLNDSFTRAKDMLSEKSRFGHTLYEIFRQSRTSQEIQQRLSEARKELGMFKGKEKSAADFILSKTQEFEKYNRASSSVSALEQQLEAAKAEEVGLDEQFKTIILNSWEAQSKINELTGRTYSGNLPLNLSFRLKHHIESFANLQRWESGKQVGKYKQWYDANQDPKNRTLYDTWKNVTERAGGLNLIYHNPKETKEQK